MTRGSRRIRFWTVASVSRLRPIFPSVLCCWRFRLFTMPPTFLPLLYTINSSVMTCTLWCLHVMTIYIIYISLCYWYFSRYSTSLTFQSLFATADICCHYSIPPIFRSLLNTADISGSTLYRWHFSRYCIPLTFSSLLDAADFLVIIRCSWHFSYLSGLLTF